jgi:hypothetical protein
MGFGKSLSSVTCGLECLRTGYKTPLLLPSSPPPHPLSQQCFLCCWAGLELLSSDDPSASVPIVAETVSGCHSAWLHPYSDSEITTLSSGAESWRRRKKKKRERNKTINTTISANMLIMSGINLSLNKAGLLGHFFFFLKMGSCYVVQADL